jgi:hypothetical protein
MQFLILSFAIALTPAQAQESLEFANRYPVKNASQKIVDNQGDGQEDLYGNRNLRAVLNGIYYRGGANNRYHRTNRRNNMNPLPNDGLQNLCEEGFSKAIYLYEANYETAPKITNCKNFQNEETKITYDQVSVLRYELADLRRIHAEIFNHIRSPRLGPILAHCWNGWHASGYVAATALRQFCGFAPEQAVKYWDAHTDGNNTATGYEAIRRRIRAFEPDPKMQISTEEQKKICPQPDTFLFSSR